jgi:hypothetical protein
MNYLEQTTQDTEEINPWTDLWTQPRQTINWITGHFPSLLVTLALLYLGGVCYGIEQAQLKEQGDSMEASQILTTALFLSGFGGLLTYSLWIWAIDFCASWLGGRGNFKKTQIAFAWAMLPLGARLILTLIGYALFDQELFTSDRPVIDGSDFLTIAMWIYEILGFVLGVWHVVLLIVLVSQVQRLSVIKTIASIAIGFLMTLLPFILIVLLFHFR